MTDRIVISGRGLVTPLGNGLSVNTDALKTGRSGLRHIQDWQDRQLDAQVAGLSDPGTTCPLINAKNRRFMSANSLYAVTAAYEAITEAGFTVETLPKDSMALINGCAGSAYDIVYESCKAFERDHRLRRLSPFAIPRIMPSSAVANMSLLLGIRGESYDVSCACTSSAIAIVSGIRLLLSGEYEYVLVGGSEEVTWENALGFTVMRALSKAYNDETASRPFDKSRDGFVLGEGAGMLVLEKESSALKRGIRPKAVLSGFAANSNASDMVVPDAQSSTGVIKRALQYAGLSPADIRYINTHGTATPIGDPVEMNAIKMVFNASHDVAINSTKSQTGHMIGAAGAVEAIFTTLMMEHSFVSPTLNLKDPEDEFAWADLVREPRMNYGIKHALSNSFGFGGTNACLVFSKWE